MAATKPDLPRARPQSPIRVLLAIGSLEAGGSERQLITILRHLNRERFQPLLYVVDRQGPLVAEVPEDVPIFSFWDQHQPPRWYVPGAIHRMQVRHFAQVLAEQQPDVVYDRNYFMTFIAGPATQRQNIPRLSVIVGDPRLQQADPNERFLFLKRRLLRRAYRTAYRVVCVSNSVRQAALHAFHLDPQQVTTVYNFVDLPRVDGLSRMDADLAADRFHVVTAGRLQQEKGHWYLLRAIQRLVQQRRGAAILLHVLGQGPLAPQLQAFVAEHDLGRHVRFHGFCGNPFATIRAAQLFCLPSLVDALPNALLEAMACRTPVLATACPGGIGEILDDGRYGRLVPPADEAALADALEDAMIDYESWRRLVEPARKHVEACFSPAAGMARLEQLLMNASSGDD